MSKIRIISDLHLEFYKTANIIGLFKSLQIKDKADHLILAGDVTNYDKLDKFKELLDSIKPDYKKIYYVIGNHEYYNNNGFIKKTDVVDVFRNFSANNGLTFLHNNEIEEDNFIIKGTPLWSDITKSAFSAGNDQNYISFEDYHKNHKESVDFLVSSANTTQVTKTTIIVTHHMPSYSLIDRKYARYSHISSMFATNLDSLINTTRPTYWIYGHTHTRNILKITHKDNESSTTFMCNPLGYPNESQFSDMVFSVV